MPQSISDKFQEYTLEEYRALRDESLRCSSIISNTIWLSTSTIAITIGGGISILQNQPELGSLFLLLLLLESFAASTMYLSELWKYARVGYYIQTVIENSFWELFKSKGLSNSPIFWEHWIKQKRANSYYLISLFVLQLPSIISIALWSIVFFSIKQNSILLKWLQMLDNEWLLFYLIPVIFFINIIFIVHIGLNIVNLNKKPNLNIDIALENVFEKKKDIPNK